MCRNVGCPLKLSKYGGVGYQKIHLSLRKTFQSFHFNSLMLGKVEFSEGGLVQNCLSRVMWGGRDGLGRLLAGRPNNIFAVRLSLGCRAINGLSGPN